MKVFIQVILHIGKVILLLVHESNASMDIVEAHIFLIKEQLFEIFECGICFNVSLRIKLM